MVKIYAKHSNRHNFICVQDIDTILCVSLGFSGSANSNMVYKISKEPMELPWQPNLAKINQNCTDFSSAQEIEDFFARIVRFSGSANSNMLSKTSSAPRQLSWQPNLDKSKPKFHKFQFCARIRGIPRMYSGVYGVSEFKYVTRIF